jgi:hypothetical protein
MFMFVMEVLVLVSGVLVDARLCVHAYSSIADADTGLC